MSLVNSRNIPLTDNEKFEALQAKSGMTTTVLPTAVEENFSQYSSTGGVTPLMQACQQGHESSVRQLLHKDSRIVLERDRTGKTALHYCAENSSLTCIDQILSVDPSLLSARDEDGYTPLHLATIAGNRSVVRYLLSKGADVHATDNEKHTAVHWATVCGEVDLLELLIESGGNPSTPDIHGAYPIHYAAQMCGPNSELGQDVQTGLLVLQKLLQKGVDVSVKDQDGRQPLLWAASAEVRPSHVYCPSGSADAILALVNAGADVTADDKDGLTALHCAASRGHVDCLDVLISLCSAEVDTLDGNGCTPLFYAATLGHADCTELLLKHGSIPDRQDRKGRTPAHCGAAKGQLETLKLLHKRGADLWKRNVKGDLPLHEAIQSGRKDLVMWLLSLQPTSVNAPNNDGRCPLHIAAINNNTEMCKIIMDYKAAVNPIMRNSRGQLLTPVDAAVARGNKGCAKYLQLHGGLPAIRLTDKRALQAAMQRALEFEPTGHTGATPSDLTGELTESSSPTMSKAPFFLEIPPSALLTPKDGISDGHVSSATIGLQMGYPYDQIDSGSQTEGGTPGFQGPEKRSKKVISAQPENDSSENSDVDVSKGKVKTRRKTKRSMRSARNNESSKQQSDDSSYETSNENMQEGMSTKTVKKVLKGSRKGVTINKEKERLLGDLNHDAENENRDKEVADDEDMENGEAMDEIGGLEKAIIESKKDGEARIDGKEKDEATEDVKENDEGTKEVRENSKVSMKGTDIDEVTKEGRGNKAKMKDQRKKTPTKKGKNVKISVNDKEILELKEDIREAGRRVMSGGPRKVESIDSNMKKKRSGQNLPMDMSVTRAMQTTVRKYALERRLFQQLLDLKRMQIRNSRANEHMLIKRMIDEYGKDDMIGLKSYAGSYSFSNYEKYLYDQLRTLQATDTTKIPHFKSNGDVEKLTKALRKANVPDLNEPIDDLINREKDVNSCNQSTHRCHHAIHAYTGVPCAAYLAQYRKNEQRNKGSLPQVAGAGTSKVAGVTIFESKKNDIGMARSTYDPKKPLTVQLQPTKAPRLQGIKPRAEPRKGIKKNLKISDVGPTSVHAAPESKKVITQKVDEGSPSVSSAPELNKDFMQKVEDGPTSVRSAPELNKDIIQKLDDGSTSFRSEPELNKDFTQKRNDDSTSVHSSTELGRSAAHNGDEGSPDSSSLDNKDGSLQKVGEVLSETFDASDFRAINDSTSSVPLPQDPESTSNPKSPTTPITLQEQTSILKKSPQKS